MKNKPIFLSIIVVIVVSVIGINQSFGEQTDQDCIFTASLEKSWILFQERPWVSGFVINCNDDIQYHLKDTVFVRILDIDGNVVDDKWIPEARANPIQQPSKYIFNDQVYRGGSQGNADVTKAETIHIRENQYFFYMPQIHSIDFEHRGIYQIELTYDDNVRTIWFAVLDPDIWWQEVIE